MFFRSVAAAALAATALCALPDDHLTHPSAEHGVHTLGLDAAGEKAFRCEVCRAFCDEFEGAVAEKAADEEVDLAVQWARGNTSNHRWDEAHLLLRPPTQRQGAEAIDAIYATLDDEVLTHYNRGIIIHALHAAAHSDVPAKMPSHFCRRVLCEQRLKTCAPHHDDRPYATLTQSYEHFLHVFHGQHHDPDTMGDDHFAEPRVGHDEDPDSDTFVDPARLDGDHAHPHAHPHDQGPDQALERDGDL